MRTPMKILALSGSLRHDSFNTRLLTLSRSLVPAEVEVTVYHCGQLPFYNQDLDGPDRPGQVTELLELIDAADALLFATPEYNYSIPGVLKNALDWASRPAFNSVLKNRPAGILSASMSAVGGARAQLHLKQVLAGTLTPVYPVPEVLVPFAHQVFASQDGVAELSQRLTRYLDGFISWVAGRAPASK